MKVHSQAHPQPGESAAFCPPESPQAPPLSSILLLPQEAKFSFLLSDAAAGPALLAIDGQPEFPQKTVLSCGAFLFQCILAWPGPHGSPVLWRHLVAAGPMTAWLCYLSRTQFLP